MGNRSKKVFIPVALLCIVVSALAYTRPLPIEQRYPVLDLSQCTLIQGYFNDRTSTDNISFTIAPDDPHFDEIIELFQSASFKTRLRNILPQGTKYHTYGEDDFKWFVMFRFEDVIFPSGDTGSGDILHVNNFFGDIELFFDGELVACSVNNQGQWLNDVMSILIQCSN